MGPDGLQENLCRRLHNTSTTRNLEVEESGHNAAHALMEQAGLAVAQLTMAIAPHAKSVWIACGPGNNGGDGLIAALYLKQWGKSPIVTLLNPMSPLPADASAALEKARRGGVQFETEEPVQFDVCVDALFGIGRLHPFNDRCKNWIARINQGNAPVISVDIPSGLDADTGAAAMSHVQASVTLSLLTLKPGLFTALGRDACGDIWFNDLGVPNSMVACAELNTMEPQLPRPHNTHKGTFGDVAIVGGDTGMTGAALLAGSAALRAGAGRVYVALLGSTIFQADPTQPELMLRDVHGLDVKKQSIVAGCGGGAAIAHHLEHLIRNAMQLVLDADALNSIATSVHLQSLIRERSGGTTAMTPHPLEAARLLGVSAADIQADRLTAAQRIAQHFQCAVVLKGSGSVIAAPEQTSRINPTGNARLASAGTGDVLAGMVGARMAAGEQAFHAACHAVFQHGKLADCWPPNRRLTAGALIAEL
jgi:ADP-dependent NAD(P)H-hydrate dehydratase / NAD(P)H-hydrate epimerase